MNALVRKEIRLLLWPWVTAMLLATLPAWLYAILGGHIWPSNATAAGQGVLRFSYICFGFGAIILSLTSFGQEFASKTFSLLLSQPTERYRIWRTKALLLGIAMLITMLTCVVCLEVLVGLRWYYGNRLIKADWAELDDTFKVTLQIVLIAYSGGLWTTLLIRNFSIALCMTILAPFALLTGLSWVTDSPNGSFESLAPMILSAYSVAGFLFARWLFLRAQDVPWTGGPVLMSESAGKRFALTFSFRRSGPYLAFIRKELQLQQVSFLIAALVLVCHLGTFLVRWFHPQNFTTTVWMLINNIWIVWFALPLFIGSIPVAEERRLGTLESLLTQPISSRAQFLIKLLITAALAILFGAIVPWILEHGWNHFGPHNELMSDAHFGGLLPITLVIACCAFFASTVSRQTIEALCLGGVLTPIVYAMVQFLAWNPNAGGTVPRYGLLTYPIFIPICLSTVVYLAWKNYQRTHLRWTNLVGTFGVLMLSGLTAWGIASFTWNRTWELLTPLEPTHGKPVLHNGDHVKITSCFGPIALLPDGKIWMAQYKIRACTDDRKEQHVTGIALTNAQFLDANWIDLAAAGWQAFAIKADGTLWQIRSTPRDREHSGDWSWWPSDSPKQFGKDSDWRSLAAADNYVLALKHDGSLWGWGYNEVGELGPGPKVKTNAPVRLWHDSDWVRVFPLRNMCIGIKRDGTIWRWGKQFTFANDPVPDYQPVQLPFSGTNWTSFAGPMLGGAIGRSCILCTRSDGTLWGFSDGSPESVKSRAQVFGNLYRIGPTPIPMSDRTDWLAVSGLGSVSALTQDGSWFLTQSSKPNRKRSHYSDWLAISPRYEQAGLAADGTISSWEYVDAYPYYFADSRRPTWSTNIFATR